MKKILTLLFLFYIIFPFQAVAAANEPVKGIYMTANSVSNQAKFNKAIKMIDNTALNAMVIDVKNDDGFVTYDSQIPLVNQIGSDRRAPIHNMRTVIKTLKEKNIYTIARIVVFKDPYLAKKKNEWAIKRKDGTVWQDHKGIEWIDPYRKEVWDYTLQIAKEAVNMGFDEIQWDYVRFPDRKNLENEVIFPLAKGQTRDDAIIGFLKYSYPELKKMNAVVSADVFGLTTSAQDDMGIGQTWKYITRYVDVISPMMYPSHYAKGSYGIKNPESSPYQIVHAGLKAALRKNNAVKSHGLPAAMIRPWYQDFDMNIPYGIKEVQAQIQAGNELGISGYLLWNPRNNYSFGTVEKSGL